MTDARLRERQRAADATGSLEDHAALLRERMRVGDLDADGLALAAYLGHKPSRLVVLGHDEQVKLPRPSDARSEHVGWLTTHVIRDVAHDTPSKWAAVFGSHPMAYVPKLAGALIARGTWRALCEQPGPRGWVPPWLERSHMLTHGRVIACMGAWAECPCETCRARVGESVDRHAQHDPENWWRSAAASIAGYCEPRWAIGEVVSRCVDALIPSDLRSTTARRWTRVARDQRGRELDVAFAQVRGYLAPMIPWALRGSQEPAVFRPVPSA